MTQLSRALEQVRAELTPGGDSGYFAFHARRFESHLRAIHQVAPAGARVLDIGSHYLHLSSALALLGFQVTALDVSEFQELDFVADRARRHGIRTETTGDLGKGQFLGPDTRDAFDVVVFCEILEHITFNPVRFWRRVYDLLRPGGTVYLSTPNSLRLANTLKTAYRLAGRRGVGIPLDEIFGHVTYGHHWKEYSAGEIVEYFRRLSPDFQPGIRFVDYGLGGSPLSRPLARIAGVIPGFRPHIEAVVRLPRKTSWRAREKSYSE